MNEKFLVLTGLAALLAIYSKVKPEPPPVARESWTPEVDSILADLGKHKDCRGHLLAFSTQVDPGGLYVEAALLATESYSQWALWHIYRHPRHGQKEWRLAIVYDAPVTPYREFNQRPSLPQLRKFIRDSWWKFRPLNSNFRLLSGTLYENTWLETLGFPNPFRFRQSAGFRWW